MLITNCPRCSETIRVPTTDVPGDVTATCPWCQDSFAMAELHEVLPPMLIIDHPMDEQIADAMDDDVAPEIVAEQFTPDLDTGLEPIDEVDDDTVRLEDDSVRQEIEFTIDADADTDSDLAAVGTPVAENFNQFEDGFGETQIDAANSKPRKRKSSIGVMLQALLGAVISIPAAGLILWFVGSAPDLGFWPFDGSQAARKASQTNGDGSPRRGVKDSAANNSDNANSLSSDLREPGDRIAETLETDVEIANAGALADQALYAADESDANEVIDPADSEYSRQRVNDAIELLSEFSKQPSFTRTELTTMYSAVANVAADNRVATDQLLRLLKELQISTQFDEIASHTGAWLGVEPTKRPDYDVINDGVLLVGQLQVDENAKLVLNDGENVLLSGDFQESESGTPVVGLGRIVRWNDPKTPVVELRIRGE